MNKNKLNKVLISHILNKQDIAKKIQRRQNQARKSKNKEHKTPGFNEFEPCAMLYFSDEQQPVIIE